ncbi:Iron(II)-dependent oxidoreductase EgtB [compost metagenome]
MKTNLLEKYQNTRAMTSVITAPLFVEDYCIQSSRDVSPPKWHLGHTTWFFEVFILEKFKKAYSVFNKELHPVFNSYYETQGSHWVQAERGALSRPSVDEVNNYRQHVDESMQEVLSSSSHEMPLDLFLLGINHEQQHQELLYMDIKNILFNQHAPQKYWGLSQTLDSTGPGDYLTFDSGLVEIGHEEAAFSYDNELPSHRHYLHPFKMRSTLVSNAEYLQFIQDGGYTNPEYWHSDGWRWVQSTSQHHPLYWVKQDKTWLEYEFSGLKEIHLDRPVCHVNFYEASAFARYNHKRLPTEFEWEHAARTKKSRLKNLTDSLWQWTASSYSPYPRHQWQRGAMGEYNTKFMINQIVLRGGSAWTPPDHTRMTYRNYYYPEKKWAFTGIRLAEDIA